MTADQAQSLLDRLHRLRPPIVEEPPPAPSPQILDLQRRYQALLDSRGRQPDPVEQPYVSPWASQLTVAKARWEEWRNSPKVYPPFTRSQSQSQDDFETGGNCLQTGNEDSPITKKKRRTPFSEDNPLPSGGYGRKYHRRVNAARTTCLNTPEAKANRQAKLEVVWHFKRVEKNDAQIVKDSSLQRSGGLLTRNDKGEVTYRTSGPERQRRSDSMREARAPQLYLDWLIGRHCTAHLPLPFPDIDFREKSSLLIPKLCKRSHMNALYYEHIDQPDPTYVDEHGNVTPHCPDWAVLLDDTVCLVELERTTLSQQLWYAIKKRKLPQFKRLRKELMSTVLRFFISSLRYRHVEGGALSVILAKPELRASLSLPLGEDGKIPSSTLFEHFCSATEKYLDHIDQVLAFHFPAEHSFLTSVIDEFDQFFDAYDKMTEEQLLSFVTQIIQKVRIEQNFQDDVITIQNEMNALHLKSTYSDSSRLNTKHLKYH